MFCCSKDFLIPCRLSTSVSCIMDGFCPFLVFSVNSWIWKVSTSIWFSGVHLICVGHNGQRHSPWSSRIFWTHLRIKLKGEKQYVYIFAHEIEKASVFSASASGFQEMYLFSCLLRRDAIKSISGLPQFFVSWSNTFLSNIRSILSLQFLDRISATFKIPGTCAAEIQIFLSIHQCQIVFDKSLQITELMPPMELM